MALAQAGMLINVVNSIHPFLQHVVAARLGLPSTTDAPAWAGHDLLCVRGRRGIQGQTEALVVVG